MEQRSESHILKPLLVGELNPYGADPRYALFPEPSGSAGGRLARILGLSKTEYLRTFDRVNLCEGRWDGLVASRAASTIKWSPGPHVIVMLGNKVTEAFGFEITPVFGNMSAKGHLFVRLPHPSGRCRIWNERGANLRARRALEEAGISLPSSPLTRNRRRRRVGALEHRDPLLNRGERVGGLLGQLKRRRS